MKKGPSVAIAFEAADSARRLAGMLEHTVAIVAELVVITECFGWMLDSTLTPIRIALKPIRTALIRQTVDRECCTFHRIPWHIIEASQFQSFSD